MLDRVFATKLAMSQAWTTTGKRLAVTKCRIDTNAVVGVQQPREDLTVFEIGYGTKKFKNMTKPLKGKLTKSGFSVGMKQLAGVTPTTDAEIKPGDIVALDQVLKVGDIVAVQGTTKGRGFAGAIKRHGFSGGPKTHGQSDRERAVGSIGAGTYPGKVWKGKKMPGHYGVETKTVKGLVVVHIDPATNEVLLSGPIPGHLNSIVAISPTGKTKNVELDFAASGITPAAVEPETVEAETQDTASEEAQA